MSRAQCARLLTPLFVLAALPACSNTPASGGTSAARAPTLVVITAGGTALGDGATDVPPTLDLHLTADVALKQSNAGAQLDGSTLSLRADGDGLSAAVAPMQLGSAHTLVVSIAGRPDAHIGFRVVSAGQAFAAVHVEQGPGTVLDLALSLPPKNQQDVVAALPLGGAPIWVDPRHLRATWATPPSGTFHLRAGIPLDRGTTLGDALDLALRPAPRPGTLTIASPPASPQLPAHPIVVAFSVPTATSRESVAAHIAQISVLSPSGLTAGADGSLRGDPDDAAVASARVAGVPIWPLVQNAGFDAPAVHALLTNAAAQEHLVGALRAAAAAGGWGGVHLDLENVAETDRDALSALVRDLAVGLHADGRRLAVAAVPHRPGHENAINAAFDLAAIGRAADLVTLMAYEQHSASTDPGPVAGLQWDSQILDGSATAVGDPARTLLGMPLYARTWGQGGQDSADSYASAVSDALQQAGGARVDYDFTQGTPLIAPARGGLPITYFDDATSLARKLALAGARHLVGIAVWRLGFEDPRFWSLLPAKATPPA